MASAQNEKKEDYYKILEVDQSATPEIVAQSYKRLALKLHPDRNTSHNATADFQQLGGAYETLKDESKRRAYDLIYPSIAGNRPYPQTTQTPPPPPQTAQTYHPPRWHSHTYCPPPQTPWTSHPPPHYPPHQTTWEYYPPHWTTETRPPPFQTRQRRAPPFQTPRTPRPPHQAPRPFFSPPQTTQTPRPPSPSNREAEPLSEAAQIAALEKLKEDRGVKWRPKKYAFELAISALQEEIRQVEQEIKNLDDISAAEAAEEARKNTWLTWVLSPISRKVEDSEEEKARKDREKQERGIERDMRERRLSSKKEDLKKEENLFRKAKAEVDAADLVEDREIQVIKQRIQARDAAERESFGKFWNQEPEEEEEEEEGIREMPKARAAARKRQAEQNRRRRMATDYNANYFFGLAARTRVASPLYCQHGGWRIKEQRRTACPRCSKTWSRLPQCLLCQTKVCPICQKEIQMVGRNPIASLFYMDESGLLVLGFILATLFFTIAMIWHS